jgi:hypothetical protein
MRSAEAYSSWTLKHFLECYQPDHQGQRSYAWAKQYLQSSGLVKRGKHKGKHRKRRNRYGIV